MNTSKQRNNVFLVMLMTCAFLCVACENPPKQKAKAAQKHFYDAEQAYKQKKWDRAIVGYQTYATQAPQGPLVIEALYGQALALRHKHQQRQTKREASCAPPNGAKTTTLPACKQKEQKLLARLLAHPQLPSCTSKKRSHRSAILYYRAFTHARYNQKQAFQTSAKRWLTCLKQQGADAKKLKDAKKQLQKHLPI